MKKLHWNSWSFLVPCNMRAFVTEIHCSPWPIADRYCQNTLAWDRVQDSLTFIIGLSIKVKIFSIILIVFKNKKILNWLRINNTMEINKNTFHSFYLELHGNKFHFLASQKENLNYDFSGIIICNHLNLGGY